MTTLLDIDLDNVEIIYMAQRVYQDMADGALNKRATLAPKSARMQQASAERLINAGNAAGAIEHYRAELKINPNITGVHFEIDESLMQQSAAENAAADAEKELLLAIESDGDSAKIEYELRRIAESRSQPEEALRRYKSADALDPHDSDAQLAMAKALMAMQKPDEAKPYLESVVAAEPMNTDARYHLAMAYKKTGQKEVFMKQMAIFRQSKELQNQVDLLLTEMNRPVRHPSGPTTEEENDNTPAPK